MSLRAKRSNPAFYSIGWILRLAAQNDGTAPVHADGAQIRQHPTIPFRHSGLRAGVFTKIKRRHTRRLLKSKKYLFIQLFYKKSSLFLDCYHKVCWRILLNLNLVNLSQDHSNQGKYPYFP